MAHQISIIKTDDGREIEEAFYAGNGKQLNPAWHGLGQNTLNALTSYDAAAMAHLLWDVRVVPSAANVDGQYIDSDEFCLTIRDDNNFILGQVKNRYAPVQNWQAFSFLDSLVNERELFYESAGALDGGRRVWILARMPHIYKVTESDVIKQYLLFVNHHDGTGSVKCFPTEVRVVCQNTLSLALRNDGWDGITIRHVGDIEHKVNAARNALAKVSKVFSDMLEIQRELAKRKLETGDFVKYVDTLFPVPTKDGKVLTEGKAVTMRNNKVADIASLFYRDERQKLDGIENTAWAALNAVTQYVDHESRTRKTGNKSDAEVRMNAAMLGSGASLKREAFSVAQSLFLGDVWNPDKSFA